MTDEPEADPTEAHLIGYDFLGQVKRFAGDGSLEMHLTLYKIGKAWPEFELCSPGR